MRPPRQTVDEGPGSPSPVCHSEVKVGESWVGLELWGTTREAGRPCPEAALGGEYSLIRPHSQDLARTVTWLRNS